jgi:AraC-like DNA-binding protein
MSGFEVHHLLQTASLTVRHVRCGGACRHRGAEECASATHLVFPYRGVYLRHVGREQAVADANHVLFFNAAEGYQISHPVAGGDRSLVFALREDLLRELAPAHLLTSAGALRFQGQYQRIDPRAQALVALLRHGLANGTLEPLEAETLLLTLISRSLGPRTSHEPAGTNPRRRLADRVKLLLASDLSRRWTLAEIAAEIGGSPVYLTQVFQQIEGLPLYRYQLHLRLARALDLVPRHDDLAALGFELGFSSHSHFTSAFRQAFGRTPSEFKRSTNR